MHNLIQPSPIRTFVADRARVEVYASAEEQGRAAASRAIQLSARAIQEKGRARIMVATGNSQIPLIESFVEARVDWSAVELFHMDEYVGLSSDHPASFRSWIKTRVADKVHPRSTHYLAGDAADLPAEMARYTQLLLAAPIDIAFVGIGENGHIAFNDPPTADFRDSLTVKKVTLDQACRRQQAGEGHFADLSSVPKEAVTVSCPGLFGANAWVCSVPEQRKAEAVRSAIEGPIAEQCPASLIRRHPNAYLYLDRDSASLLER